MSLLGILRIHNFVIFFAYGFACNVQHSTVNLINIWIQKLDICHGMKWKLIQGSGFN
jgi:hypothetical protein